MGEGPTETKSWEGKANMSGVLSQDNALDNSGIRVNMHDFLNTWPNGAIEVSIGICVKLR